MGYAGCTSATLVVGYQSKEAADTAMFASSASAWVFPKGSTASFQGAKRTTPEVRSEVFLCLRLDLKSLSNPNKRSPDVS